MVQQPLEPLERGRMSCSVSWTTGLRHCHRGGRQLKQLGLPVGRTSKVVFFHALVQGDTKTP